MLNTDTTYSYYDDLGNIGSITRYGYYYNDVDYDEMSRLTYVGYGYWYPFGYGLINDSIYTYTYDDRGNILTKNYYNQYADEEIMNPPEHVYNYEYNNTNWRDQLTSYDGQAITYDEIGNPLTYINGVSMTWQNGRRLSSYTKGGVTTSYSYDMEGVRQSKSSNSGSTEYYMHGSMMLGEKKVINNTEYTLYYLYDAAGSKIGFECGDNTYYYVKSALGDVTEIINESGAVLGHYVYDIWGKNIIVIDTSNNIITDPENIMNINPIRYRGYYYDTESGFYYLQTRYYDPETSRFINADGFVSTGTGLGGYNMYAYCENNPVMNVDPTGMFFCAITGAIGGAIAGFMNASLTGDNLLAGILIGAGTGAMAGFAVDIAVASGSILAITLAVLIGGVASGLNYRMNEYANNREPSWSETFLHMGIGAACTLLSYGTIGPMQTSDTLFKNMIANDKKLLFGETTKVIRGKVVQKNIDRIKQQVVENVGESIVECTVVAISESLYEVSVTTVIYGSNK